MRMTEKMVEQAVKAVDDDSLAMAEAGTPEKAPVVEELSHSRKHWRWIASVGIVVTIALAVGLTVGLTAGKDGSKDQNTDTQIPGTDISGTDIPGADTSGTDNNTPVDPITTVEEQVYNTSLGPLPTEIPLFSSNITQAYSSREELEKSLIEVGKFLANNVINRNLGIPGYEHVAMPVFRDDYAEEGGPVQAPAPGDPTGEVDATDGTSSHETNNQEKGVDEGDIVKADNGTFVYAAYGDTLVVLNVTSGNIVTQIQMPSQPESVTAPERSYPYYPTAIIESLLLTSNRLVVVMSGYDGVLEEELDVSPIITEYGSTHVRVYDTSPLYVDAPLEPELKLLGSKNLNGYFREARSMGDNVHIVSMTGIDMYYSMIHPLERFQPMFTGLTDEEYLVAASRHAENVLIPALVEGLINDISMGGTIPRLARISLWQTTSSGTDAESVVFGNGIIQSMAQITSFNVLSPTGLDNELEVSTAGVFLPSSWVTVYATEQLLVIAGQGWNFSPTRSASTEETYLVGFRIFDGVTEPAAVGHVAGYLLNQFSLDYVVEDGKGYLRVATTIQNMWMPQPLIDEGGNTVSVQQLVPTTENQVLILEVPATQGNKTGVMTEVSRIGELGKEGEVFTALRFLDDIGFAVTFERTDPFYVLDLDVHNPSVLGQLDNITGFSRYMHPINDDKSLIIAVGREATPQGVDLGLQITLFDVSDPVFPLELHRLRIQQNPQGSSHSAAEFQHRAFRYIDLSDETTQAGLLLMPVTLYSWQDPKQYFDGFSVFSIKAQEGITQVYNVSHSYSYEYEYEEGCVHWFQFQARSMVFNGEMLTLKVHTVNSTDLGTGEPLWGLEMACKNY